MKFILTVFASIVALSAAAEASAVQVCWKGVCVEKDRDGRGVDVHPDRRGHYPPRHPGYYPPPPPPRHPGYYPPPPTYYPPPYHPPRSGHTQFLRCESWDGRYQTCHFNDFRVDRIFLDRVHSRGACVEGRTWGVNRGQIWVSNGCRATFRIHYW